MASNDVSTESHKRGIVIAKGPFIILAYGYLSLPLEIRDHAWIRCPDGDVMPGEIEAVMRRWHQHARLNPDPR